MITNVYAMNNYDRMCTEKVLGNGKSDNKNKKTGNKKKTRTIL